MCNKYAINEQKSNDYDRVKLGAEGIKNGKYDVKSKPKWANSHKYALNWVEI